MQLVGRIRSIWVSKIYPYATWPDCLHYNQKWFEGIVYRELYGRKTALAIKIPDEWFAPEW